MDSSLQYINFKTKDIFTHKIHCVDNLELTVFCLLCLWLSISIWWTIWLTGILSRSHLLSLVIVPQMETWRAHGSPAWNPTINTIRFGLNKLMTRTHSVTTSCFTVISTLSNVHDMLFIQERGSWLVFGLVSLVIVFLNTNSSFLSYTGGVSQKYECRLGFLGVVPWPDVSSLPAVFSPAAGRSRGDGWRAPPAVSLQLGWTHQVSTVGEVWWMMQSKWSIVTYRNVTFQLR